MKKTLSLLLALVMCLSLAACGGGNDTPAQDTTETPTTTEAPTEMTTEVPTEPVVKLALGETASTDLADFTLEASQFTYYVSNNSSNYYEPTEEPNPLYAASIGHCYVSLTFTITNKDRGGSISYAGSFAEWHPNWTVHYGDNDYTVKGFDLNNNDGGYGINLSFSTIMNRETGEIIKKHDSSNYLLSAGETVTLRTFGVIGVDPENLTDGYELTIGVLNSKGEHEYFTYTVPAR